MIHRNYDNWRTAHSDPEPLLCSECGYYEALDTFCIDDPDDEGMVKKVSPCHECIGQFKRVTILAGAEPRTNPAGDPASFKVRVIPWK